MESEKRMVDLNAVSDLKVGDIVRGKTSHRTFVVVATYGDRATAVSNADITNAVEWQVLKPKEA